LAQGQFICNRRRHRRCQGRRRSLPIFCRDGQLPDARLTVIADCNSSPNAVFSFACAASFPP
jgi:hypothetical protein